MTPRLSRTTRHLVLIAAVCFASVESAGAAPGTHFTSLEARTLGQSVWIELGSTDPAETEDSIQESARLGGATLLVATSPGGPPVAFVTIAPPWSESDGFDGYGPSLFLRAAPPGNYWLLMVVGLTTNHSAPASAWIPLVVPPACSGLPGAPILTGEVTGSTVSLAVTGGSGCAWDRFVLEYGTSPGAANLGTLPLANFGLSVSNVPAGIYYLRARAVNAAGAGPASRELPLRVPTTPVCSDAPVNATSGLAASVSGNQVVVSWRPPPTGAAPTFYQLLIKNPASPDPAFPIVTGSLIFPASTTSLSAVVPSGVYRLQVLAGNSCRTSLPLGGDLVFTVP